MSTETQPEGLIWPDSKEDYELICPIGNGASATVYKARCLAKDEEVAVKIIDLEHGNSSFLEEIRQEIQTMRMTRHNNLVQFHTVFLHESSLYIVMPLLEGSIHDIMHAVSRDGLREEAVGYILLEVVEALVYFHSTGRIHRDVKAGNILVDTHLRVFLADFGVSASMFDAGSRVNKRQTFVGTPCWMAPEVVEQNNKGYDQKADVWSLGITALEMMYGAAPHSDLPAMKVLIKTLQRDPPGPPPETSSKMKSFIHGCLKRSPQERLSMKELLGILQAWAAAKKSRIPDGKQQLGAALARYVEFLKTAPPRQVPQVATGAQLHTSWKFSGTEENKAAAKIDADRVQSKTSHRPERICEDEIEPVDRVERVEVVAPDRKEKDTREIPSTISTTREPTRDRDERTPAERAPSDRDDHDSVEGSRPDTPAESAKLVAGGRKKGRFTVRRSEKKPPGEGGTGTGIFSDGDGEVDRFIGEKEPSIRDLPLVSARDEATRPVATPSQAKATTPKPLGSGLTVATVQTMLEQQTAVLEQIIRPVTADTGSLAGDMSPGAMQSMIDTLLARNKELAARNEELLAELAMLQTDRVGERE
ncbi:serine/threonine-protein kinase [Carpediemonas membranifera]|uniref:Serine/threonine-protein kinase n=1 Tax=Carpediemonas membranifera TaxID=201153 RepID=A0A8J6DXE1_9EUKA|nr:serine/threonine-protein kinase [Carpediemonas membranifera]|eukprot:KAG9389964.1 serine/threonine-protein kinase [Carpediemonas membranifera]